MMAKLSFKSTTNAIMAKILIAHWLLIQSKQHDFLAHKWILTNVCKPSTSGDGALFQSLWALRVWAANTHAGGAFTQIQ